jgi:hypothetical protein
VHDAFEGAIGAADAAHVIAPAAPAVRRVAREMHQWQARRFAPPPPAEPVAELRFPWWSYPLATAVAVLIAFLVWWGTQDTEPLERRLMAGSGAVGPGDDRYAEFEARLERGRQLRQLMWEFGGAANPEGVDALEEVQAQLSRGVVTEEEGARHIFLWDGDEEGM